MFKGYQHIERLGKDDVSNILDKDCFVFPKLDGTNGSIWFENGEIKCGSRNRELTLDNDNAGFYRYVLSEPKYKQFFEQYPTYRLFGEFLVKHQIDYMPDAYRKFYVFDVLDNNDNYLDHRYYQNILFPLQIDYIPSIGTVFANYIGDFSEFLNNKYLLNGDQTSEGIVLKRYDYLNQYGCITWAKVLSSKFVEEKFDRRNNPDNYEIPIEQKIVESSITKELVDKEYSKLLLLSNIKSIQAALLNSVYYCLITEELYDQIKKLKNPTIQFGQLQRYCFQKTKEFKMELF